MTGTKVDLTAAEQVQGVLPAANGGSGATSLAAGGAEVSSNKNVAGGYAGLDLTGYVDPGQLGSGPASSATFLRGDNVWAIPTTGSSYTPSPTSLTGPYGGWPQPSTPGLLYYCTDCDAVMQDNGTTWVRIRIGGNAGPPLGDVQTTWSAGGSTIVGTQWLANKDGMVLTVPSNGGGDNVTSRYVTYPSYPFILTMNVDMTRLIGSTVPTGYAFGGPMISDGTKFQIYGVLIAPSSAGAPWTTGWNIAAQYMSNATTSSVAQYGQSIQNIGGRPKWWRFIDDGFTRSILYSLDGIDWDMAYNESRTANLTPTQIGIYGDNYCGQPIAVRLRSWNLVPIPEYQAAPRQQMPANIMRAATR